MKTRPLACQAGLAVLFVLAASEATCRAGIVTWDNSDQNHTWSTPANWDTNVEPPDADDVVFPSGLGAAITLASGDKAKSLCFDDAYVRGSLGSGISKTGNGTLRFTGAGNSLPGQVTVGAGLLELAKPGGAGIGSGGLFHHRRRSVLFQRACTRPAARVFPFPDRAIA